MILSGFWILMVVGSLITAMGIIANWLQYMINSTLSNTATGVAFFGLLILFSALIYSPFRMELMEQMKKERIG